MNLAERGVVSIQAYSRATRKKPFVSARCKAINSLGSATTIVIEHADNAPTTASSNYGAVPPFSLKSRRTPQQTDPQGLDAATNVTSPSRARPRSIFSLYPSIPSPSSLGPSPSSLGPVFVLPDHEGCRSSALWPRPTPDTLAHCARLLIRWGQNLIMLTRQTTKTAND